MKKKDGLIINYDRFRINNYPRGWKTLQLHIDPRPRGIKQWFNCLWGWDIWYNSFPLVKTLIAANIIVWILFAR